MAWTAPRTWTTGEVVTAAHMNTHVRDNLNDLDRRTTPVGSNVATSQTTTSTSFTDLATAGPAVTATTGTIALVFLSSAQNNSAVNARSLMACAVSGATTRAATDAQSIAVSTNNALHTFNLAGAFIFVALTAGSNTFTAKYRVSAASTGTWAERWLFVYGLASA